MITYNPKEPLIFIHIPKCAGTSTRQIAEGWFGGGLHWHYVQPETRRPPKVVDFTNQPADLPQMVYGHFNSAVGLGVRNQYPEVRQFVTILRDPLDTALSNYFYSLKRAMPIHKMPARLAARTVLKGGLSKEGRKAQRERHEKITRFGGVEDYVLATGSRILDHFPVEITNENYVDVIETMFVEIGVVEHLEDTLQRIAKALGKEESLPSIPHLNPSRRLDSISQEVVNEFRERNALTYEVYDYVVARFTGGTTEA